MTVLASDLTPPEPLFSDHRIEAFDCGDPVLDEWLRKRAVNAAGDAGVRALLVDALNEQANRFYELHGFSDVVAAPVDLYSASPD